MDIFAEVKERVTMKAVLQQFHLQQDRRGNILCPFHADHRPSCKIYDNSFYCWACGAGGDVINFTARYLNVSNLEAAQYLAATFGIMTDGRKHSGSSGSGKSGSRRAGNRNSGSSGKIRPFRC